MANDPDLVSEVFSDPDSKRPIHPPQFVMIDSLLIDVTLSENHTFECEVTNFPVESGSNISDNIRPKPITVTMDGLVSNTPIGRMRDIRVKEVVDNIPLTAYAVLQLVWRRRQPVTIRTSLGKFEQMALTSLTFPRSATDGDSLHFSAAFTQIQTVVNARTEKRTAVLGGTGGTTKKKLGTKPTVAKDQKLVIWRKGMNPKFLANEFWATLAANAAPAVKYLGGGPWKGESEQVFWGELNGQGQWYHANAFVGIVQNNSVSPGRAGQATSLNDYKPLTAEEFDRFWKDNDRDIRERKTPIRTSASERRVPIRTSRTAPTSYPGTDQLLDLNEFAQGR